MSAVKPEANNRDEVCMEWHTAIKMPRGTEMAFLHDTPCMSSTSAWAKQHLLTVSEVRISGNFIPGCTVNGRGRVGSLKLVDQW